MERVGSSLTPRILTLLDNVRFVLENLGCMVASLATWCLEPNMTASVLVGLRRRPFSRNQELTASAHREIVLRPLFPGPGLIEV